MQATTEPKSADVRRVSQKVVTSLFDLNPATFSLMLRSVSKALQETANKILKVYMQVSEGGGLFLDEGEAHLFSISIGGII